MEMDITNIDNNIEIKLILILIPFESCHAYPNPKPPEPTKRTLSGLSWKITLRHTFNRSAHILRWDVWPSVKWNEPYSIVIYGSIRQTAFNSVIVASYAKSSRVSAFGIPNVARRQFSGKTLFAADRFGADAPYPHSSKKVINIHGSAANSRECVTCRHIVCRTSIPCHIQHVYQVPPNMHPEEQR